MTRVCKKSDLKLVTWLYKEHNPALKTSKISLTDWIWTNRNVQIHMTFFNSAFFWGRINQKFNYVLVTHSQILKGKRVSWVVSVYWKNLHSSSQIQGAKSLKGDFWQFPRPIRFQRNSVTLRNLFKKIPSWHLNGCEERPTGFRDATRQ